MNLLTQSTWSQLTQLTVVLLLKECIMFWMICVQGRMVLKNMIISLRTEEYVIFVYLKFI